MKAFFGAFLKIRGTLGYNAAMEKLVFGWEMARIETMRQQTDYLEILISLTYAP